MFIILEVQSNKDETAGTLVNTYSAAQKSEAESQYHLILSAAAVSTIYKHSVFMLRDDGRLVKSECYAHELPQETQPTIE